MKLFYRSVLLLFVLSGLLFSQALDINQINLTDPIPQSSDVIKGTFDNGLTYYIRKNAKPENRAQLHLVVNAGSVLETDAQQGLAHFCEHMAFNGTKHFEKHELINYLESIGMQFGPEINASTSFDETVFMLQVPTDSFEVVETALQILQDWAMNISFENEEIDKERGVIIEEWRLGRGANARMFNKHLPVLFKDSQYAVRLPIGKKEIIENFEYQTLKQFYKDWYRPDLMAVIAVGDFDTDKVQALIEEYFAGIPAAKAPRKRELYPIPDHEKPLFSIATDPEATRSIIRLYFKHDTKMEQTVADYRKGFVETIYNLMFNTRLEELAQQAEPPFLFASSSEGQLVRTKGNYFLGAFVKDNGFSTGLEALLKESNRVRKFGFTESELERAKKDMMRFMEQLNREKDKAESISYANELRRNFLTNEPIPGIEYEYLCAAKYVNSIQLEEVNQLSKEWLTKSNRVVLIDAPEKESLVVPTETELAAIFDSTDKMELDAYVDSVSDAPLVEQLPASGKVVNESKIKELDITVLTLSNGITIYCKPTDFKNDEIVFNAFSYGGDCRITEEDFIPSTFAIDVVTEGGLGQFNKIDLQKKMAGKVVSVGPWIGDLTEGLTGGASPDDMESLFQLIYLYMTAPRKDTTAYSAYLEKLAGYLANRDVSPEIAYQDTLQQVLSNYHFRSRPLSPDIVNEMDLDKSFEFYKERFADLDDMTFFFVGNIDMDKLKKYAAQYLAVLPSLPGDETWVDPGVNMPDHYVDKSVYQGLEPKSTLSLIFHGTFEWSKQNQFHLASLADLLRLRLREIVREDLGGTYGVRVSPSTSRIPKAEFKLTISLGCDPERVDELTKTILDQVELVKYTGATDEELQKIKESDLREHETNQKENRYWLSRMFSYSMDNLPLVDMLNYERYINDLSPDDIKDIALTYISLENYIRVVLYPESYNKHE